MICGVIASLLLLFICFKVIKRLLQWPREIPNDAQMPTEPQGYCVACGSQKVLFRNGYDRHTGQPLTRWGCPKC